MPDEPTPEATPAARTSRRMAWAMVWMMVSTVLLVAASFVVSVRISNERVQQFCALVVGSDNAYQAAPPSNLTPTGRQLAADMHDLRTKLNCPKDPKP